MIPHYHTKISEICTGFLQKKLFAVSDAIKKPDVNKRQVRSFNCLKRANINNVEDLISRTGEDMMKVRNMGRKSLEEVQNKLAMMGLSLASDDSSSSNN